MRPIAIPGNIRQHDQTREVLEKNASFIRQQMQRLLSLQPEVTIIIPAFNEEDNILKTLSSLSVNRTTKKIEIIIVDNNSVDDTGMLAVGAGVTCILEASQSIAAARNAGLKLAKGKYILNADADTIYPPDWIDLMIAPLYRESIAMVYGSFAFIPTIGTPRVVYCAYEYVSDLSKWINKRFREEAVNIYGSNSAFRREEGLLVNGFNHPAGANEDGWLALKLRNTFKKQLFKIMDPRALVWTSDRRIQIDGGLLKGIIIRCKRHLGIFLKRT
ncbi:MAG: glycosyltransferase family 2 protein [Chitinophagaceae bacterium]